MLERYLILDGGRSTRHRTQGADPVSTIQALAPEVVVQRHPGWQVHQYAGDDEYVAIHEDGGVPIRAVDLDRLDALITECGEHAKAVA